MTEDVFTLFGDYASSYARGERPEVTPFLERAGPEREELAELVDRYLMSVPAREPGEELVASFVAWASGEPPLLDLRARRGVRRDEVVAAILARFGLPQTRSAKVGRYVHRLETGLLDTRPVNPGVFEAWAEALRARLDDLLAWEPAAPPPAAEVPYLRPSLEAAEARAMAPAMPDEWDEVDELFTGAK